MGITDKLRLHVLTLAARYLRSDRIIERLADTIWEQMQRALLQQRLQRVESWLPGDRAPGGTAPREPPSPYLLTKRQGVQSGVNR